MTKSYEDRDYYDTSVTKKTIVGTSFRNQIDNMYTTVNKNRQEHYTVKSKGSSKIVGHVRKFD